MKRNHNAGFTFVHMLTVIIIIWILLGIMTVGMIQLKGHAEITTLMGRANSFAQAMQLYYIEHRAYPSAFPAQLEVTLAPYFDSNSNMFSTTADNNNGPDSINAMYIQPAQSDPESYMLCFESKYFPEQSVALFADGGAEVVEELEIMYNNAPINPGTSVTGGRIHTGSGSIIAPLNDTTVTVVNSFIAKDGTPYDIVKVEHGNNFKVDALSSNSSIVTISTPHGNNIVRDGGVSVQRVAGSSSYLNKVSAFFGEVTTTSSLTERGELITATPGYDAGGTVNINPNNSNDFEFQLTKPDGTMITRDHLLAGGANFSYNGQATQVRFKPKGNGNQNRLIINNEVYPLQNGTLYTLTATTMTVRLYNDKAGKGKAMGRWWLDDIVATNAYLTEGDAPVPQQADGFTLGSVVFEMGGIDSRNIRTLSRGSIVRPGTWAKGR